VAEFLPSHRENGLSVTESKRALETATARELCGLVTQAQHRQALHLIVDLPQATDRTSKGSASCRPCVLCWTRAVRNCGWCAPKDG
jgi:hypothetical protein